MGLPVLVGRFYVQATFERANDNKVTNTFCFADLRTENIGQLDTATLTNIRDTLDGFYGNRTQAPATVGSILSNALFGLKYIVYPLSQPDAAPLEIPSSTFPAAAGTIGQPMPPDVAIVITWRTAQRGKSYRGRTYVGPLGANVADVGRPNTTTIQHLAGAAGKLYGAWAESKNLRLCVMSRVPGIGANHVTHADVDNEFDTQRRRGYKTRVRTVAPVG